jgi:hypothetical protein
MVSIEIVGGHGRVFRSYPTDSPRPHTYRTYVEAVPGKRYGIRVRNHTDQRIGLVIAVDGRNILSGKRSWLRRDERMYILGPYSKATYKGWRTHRNQVNRFYFTTEMDSYAAAWNDTSAMGVIAVAVYREKEPVQAWRRDHRKKRDREARPHPRVYEQPGTGFGEEHYSPSYRVDFRPMRKPAQKYFLKYEWRETLCRRGIIHCRGNRFWDDDDFAPYPPSYHHPRPPKYCPSPYPYKKRRNT